MRSAVSRRWRSVASATGRPSTASTRSPGRRPARSAGLSSTTSTTSSAYVGASGSQQARRERTAPAGDAEVGAAHAAVGHERADDAPRGRVDRHGEAEPDAGHGGVHADDAGLGVRQRAAGVAGVEGSVGLDHAVDQAHRLAGARGQGASEPGDDAGRDGTGEAVRVADGDDELAHAELGRVAERGRRQAAGLGTQHREVRQRIGADDLEAHLACRP